MSGNPYNTSGFLGHSKTASKKGPTGVHSSTADQLKEHDPLFARYEHLAGQDRSDTALLTLRKAASIVKPIMQKHGWRVKILAEFLPPEQNLLGLNINKGYKICIRLRYHNNHDLFLPFEEVVDTLLHELCHNVWGPHDSNFHNLWETLRDEYEALVRRGYTGEGFLSAGQTLGGSGARAPPPAQMRELARINAEKRRAQGGLFSGSGQKLGGTPAHLLGPDIRRVIADSAIRRRAISRGCASGSQDAIKLSQQAESDAFATKAEEDDANNLAISQALQELMEQEENQNLRGPFDGPSSGGGLEWSAKSGLTVAGPSQTASSGRYDYPSEEEQMKWAMEDSIRCAGDVSSETGIDQQVLPGQNTCSRDDDRTASPEDSNRTVTPLDSDRNASPEESDTPPAEQPECSPYAEGRGHAASPLDIGQTAGGLRRDDHANDTSVKRKRQASRSASIPSPVRPPKQERIIVEESIEPAPETLPSVAEPLPGFDWACEVCTCINPLQFLACDACGAERPQAVLLNSQPPKRRTLPTRVVSAPKSEWKTTAPPRNRGLGWICRCGAFMEHRWWTCSVCGTLKEAS